MCYQYNRKACTEEWKYSKMDANLNRNMYLGFIEYKSTSFTVLYLNKQTSYLRKTDPPVKLVQAARNSLKSQKSAKLVLYSCSCRCDYLMCLSMISTIIGMYKCASVGLQINHTTTLQCSTYH